MKERKFKIYEDSKSSDGGMVVPQTEIKNRNKKDGISQEESERQMMMMNLCLYILSLKYWENSRIHIAGFKYAPNLRYFSTL